MQTIEAFLRQYILKIFQVLQLEQGLKESAISEIINSISYETISKLIEDKVPKDELDLYISLLSKEVAKSNDATSSEQTAQDRSKGTQATFLKNLTALATEDEIRSRMIDTANLLLSQFIESLIQDGTLESSKLDDLKKFLKDEGELKELNKPEK